MFSRKTTLILIILLLFVGLTGCNLPLPQGETQPQAQEPVSSIPMASTAAPAEPVGAKSEQPGTTAETADTSEAAPATVPGPSEPRVEVWSYPMMSGDGRCAEPGETSIFSVALYMKPTPEYNHENLDVRLEDMKLRIPGMSGLETYGSWYMHYGGTLPTGEERYSAQVDLAYEINKPSAQDFVEVTYTVNVYDQQKNLLDTVVQGEKVTVCSNDTADVQAFRSAWENRYVDGQPDLSIYQIITRYDGARPEGSFEVTVCNNGSGTLGAFEGDLALAGSSTGVQLSYTTPVQPGDCVDLYDPNSSFSSFGVSQPGTVELTASFSNGDGSDANPANNTLTAQVVVPRISPIDGALDKYRSCRASKGHEYCLGDIGPDTPIGDNPHEVMKTNGQVSVVVPAEYEQVASLRLADLSICRQKFIEFFNPPDEIVRMPVSKRLFTVSEPGPPTASPYRINYPLFGFTVQTSLNPHDFQLNWDLVRDNQCAEAHELTHVYVFYTPLPYALDEGLATYVNTQISNMTDAVTPTCTPEGLQRPWGEDTLLEPYVDLTRQQHQLTEFTTPDGELVSTTQDRYYDTAACFWQYIDSEYGREALVKVVRGILARRDESNPPCVPFLQDIVTPILGEDISSITQSRFNFGATKRSCDF